MEKSESAIELRHLIDSGPSNKIVTPHAMMTLVKETLAQNNVRVSKVHFFYGSLKKNAKCAQEILRSLLEDVVQPYLYGSTYREPRHKNLTFVKVSLNRHLHDDLQKMQDIKRSSPIRKNNNRDDRIEEQQQQQQRRPRCCNIV